LFFRLEKERLFRFSLDHRSNFRLWFFLFRVSEVWRSIFIVYTIPNSTFKCFSWSKSSFFRIGLDLLSAGRTPSQQLSSIYWKKYPFCFVNNWSSSIWFRCSRAQLTTYQNLTVASSLKNIILITIWELCLASRKKWATCEFHVLLLSVILVTLIHSNIPSSDSQV
jgi:hypothetical protein